MWNEYKSDSYRDLESWWITEEELKSKKYNNKEYDLTSKDIIRQLDQEIINLEWEITTAWILKKVILKSNLFVLNEYKKLALTWPVPPYVVIKGHKISVWDEIIVYVSPENPKKYYFDLDFTKEKVY